jgi:hypothetical protein
MVLLVTFSCFGVCQSSICLFLLEQKYAAWQSAIVIIHITFKSENLPPYKALQTGLQLLRHSKQGKERKEKTEVK